MQTKPKEMDEVYDKRPKKADEIFCYSCGHIIKRTSNVCPNCGTPSNAGFFGLVLGKREKETAILISLFGSFFAYLYLYCRAALKFWLGFFVTASSIGLSLFLALGMKAENWYLALIPAVAIWIFTIADVAFMSSKYFDN